MVAEYIHVAAGAIIDKHRRVLLSLRHKHSHQGGLWEFPGGKVEAHETQRQALDRELLEEIGIKPVEARPLIGIAHDYGDRRIYLHVWTISKYQGEVRSLEGQSLQWVAIEELPGICMPAADRPIVAALRLPDQYVITPEPNMGHDPFLTQIHRLCEQGYSLIQLRAKQLAPLAYQQLAKRAQRICHEYSCRLLLNGPPDWVPAAQADGVHLSSSRLNTLSARPLSRDYWVSASCHNLDELKQAMAIDVDFVVLSPVQTTPSHPNASPLGWAAFQQLIQEVDIPVFALGGLGKAQLSTAWEHGAQGIAGIREFWYGC